VLWPFFWCDSGLGGPMNALVSTTRFLQVPNQGW
jgi:hypothetical protein